MLLQVRVLAERRLDSQCSGGEPAVVTNGCVVETEEELAEAGNYIRWSLRNRVLVTPLLLFGRSIEVAGKRF